MLLIFEVLFSDISSMIKQFFSKILQIQAKNKKEKSKKSKVTEKVEEVEEIIEFEPDFEIEEEEYEKLEQENNIAQPVIKTDESESDEKRYNFPGFNLLKLKKKKTEKNMEAINQKGEKLIKSLKDFKIDAKILNITNGPTVTRYEIQLAAGIKVSKILGLTNDIAMALASKSIRIEAPIPGKSAVGIEVPNEDKEMVTLREIVSSKSFQESESPLTFGLGKGLGNNVVISDLKQMPHLMIAGATGSGKSVCINTMICSFLYKSTPDVVKMILIDPKMVELSVYHDIPHLLTPVITDSRDAAFSLKWAVDEMENRYRLLSGLQFRNIEAYNYFVQEKSATEDDNELEELPYIVIVIDELADLMMVAKDTVEDSICRLAQKARAVGIHLIVATQRPSVDVITGLIKANLPSRISFSVSSLADSKTILDMKGAENLLGKGDMLFKPIGSSKPARVQGAFISDKEVENITDFLRKEDKPQYLNEVTKERELDEKKSAKASVSTVNRDDYIKQDELLNEAIKIVVESKQASISMLQRKLRVGHSRAARLVDIMEEMRIVSGMDSNKPREVLIDKQDLYKFLERGES
jgi:S-DNA-T family DNA segregation ATPase FtsK/SpoIIIE